MSYHATTKAALRNAPTSLGVKLGRSAVRKKLSVAQIAAITGASRATVYSWFLGGRVSNAYRAPVEQLLKALANN